MKKNVASQSIGAQMITAADGTNFTGTVTVVITIDNGTQSSSGGTAPAHEGNGYHSYTPTQAETNGDHLAFTFTGSGAISHTVQTFTEFPQTVDNNTLISAIPTTAMRGTDSAALATVCTETRLAELDAGNLPTDIAAIPTTAMRGTDSAALATVCTETRLAELDAGNLPTDIAAIPTTAMRGTDSAALATVCTETRLAELDSGNLPTDIAAIPTTAMRGTDGANTTTPPTAVQNRQEMDSNSTQLTAIVLDTGTTLPALIDDLAIKKNTAFSNFEFLMVLSSDHVTPATGLTVTGQRSINGAAFQSVGGTIAEVSNGIYQFDALAADTNGDVITWRFLSGTADDTFVTFKTVA